MGVLNFIVPLLFLIYWKEKKRQVSYQFVVGIGIHICSVFEYILYHYVNLITVLLYILC